MIFRESKLRLAQAALADVDSKPKTLVEFGTFVGNSAIAWGAIMKELHPGDSDGIHIYSFELDPEMARIASDLVRLAGLEDLVTILEGAGAESLKSLVAEGKILPRSIDAVFFDHWENIYLPDLRLCEELNILHKGSVIMADNTDFPGAPEYLAYVQKGGSNEPGAVRYESKTLMVSESAQSRGPVSHLCELNQNTPRLLMPCIESLGNHHRYKCIDRYNHEMNLRCCAVEILFNSTFYSSPCLSYLGVYLICELR